MIVVLLVVFVDYVGTYSTKKTYTLTRSEIAHLAYDALANKSGDAAERIGLYFQFCTKEYDFGIKWLELADSFNITNSPISSQGTEGGGGFEESNR